jgi:hypothetical protein
MWQILLWLRALAGFAISLAREKESQRNAENVSLTLLPKLTSLHLLMIGDLILLL